MNQKLLTRQQASGLPWGQGYVPSTDEDEEGRIRPQPKRYDPDSMVYTDGSHKKDTNLTGSGVYGWKDGVEEHIRIRPSRSGPVHTINRAELIALLYALCHWQGHSDLVIATDSAFAMQSIKEHLQNPEAHKHNKHKNIFRAIIKQLLTRAQRQQNTSIVQVKSHIQIRGNEIADALAVEATKQRDVNMRGDYTEPFGDMVWVTKSMYDEHGEVNGAQYLSDSGPALKTAIHRNKRLGQSNQDTICCAVSRRARHCAAYGRRHWEEEGKVPDAMLRNTNKPKTGQLWPCVTVS